MAMAAIHPRTNKVEEADREFLSFLLKLQVEKGLTYAELLSIFSRQMGHIARYAIRAERHPGDESKGADEA